MSEWSLPDEAFQFLQHRLRPGATVVELGSGEGTKRLGAFAKVVSIEHDLRFVAELAGHAIIHAPIEGGWYARAPIQGGLPATYDCLVVDGPPAAIGRHGLLEHLDLFQPVPMLVDDVHRPAERGLAIALAKHRGGPLSVHYLTNGRAFATIGWRL